MIFLEFRYRAYTGCLPDMADHVCRLCNNLGSRRGEEQSCMDAFDFT